MPKRPPTPAAVAKRLAKVHDPAMRAAAAADLKTDLDTQRADAVYARDLAAMALIVHHGHDDKAVGALMGFTTRSARMKAGARVKAAHPPAADDTSRNAKYYGAPPFMHEAEAVDVVKTMARHVARIDAAWDAAVTAQHDAMRSMIAAGSPNHEVAKAAKVTASYVHKFVATKHAPVTVPTPASAPDDAPVAVPA